MVSTHTAPITGLYRFKDIKTIPGAKSLVDIVLSQTQRRTPTQVHPQFKISRIRNFYMRKVKYAQQTFHDKFSAILMEFPRLDDIHPFYSDLCNALYDRDHYKLALGQINVVRGIVDRIAKDYVKLLKYADSPYKCKMLKRAALGRMCTAVRKLGDSLQYLEEVRQHLSRLPSINPNTRTLLLTGYPNVGKSSFINSVTNANVEVQPYAFTTKSLFVGHFDYEYVRWQVIDTPGILDHPLSQRNTIELTAITALAHIQAVVLFFLDVSEECGFSIEHQVNLFHSIKVLFKNKALVIVLNKSDVLKFVDLSPEKQELINSMKEGFIHSVMIEISCLLAEGVDAAKNKACQLFLVHQTEAKLLGVPSQTPSEAHTITQVQPPSYRPPNIPESVRKRREKAAQLLQPGVKLDDQMGDISQTELYRDMEQRCGGTGVFSIDLQADWKLKKEDWKFDVIPEFFNGKNIADFIDLDIDEKLKQLELEEDRFLGIQNEENELDNQQWDQVARQLSQVHQKIQLKRIESRLSKNHAHKIMPSTSRPPKKIGEATKRLFEIGYHVEDGLSVVPRRRGSVKISELRKVVDSDDSDKEMRDALSSMVVGGNPIDEPSISLKHRLTTLSRARTKEFGTSSFSQALGEIKRSIPNRITRGLPTNALRTVAEKVRRKREAGMKRMRKAGEADRFIGTKKPRHLFSGKRGKGKTDRR